MSDGTSEGMQSPGWYEHGPTVNILHWWDGTHWTEQTAIVQSTTPPALSVDSEPVVIAAAEIGNRGERMKLDATSLTFTFSGMSVQPVKKAASPRVLSLEIIESVHYRRPTTWKSGSLRIVVVNDSAKVQSAQFDINTVAIPSGLGEAAKSAWNVFADTLAAAVANAVPKKSRSEGGSVSTRGTTIYAGPVSSVVAGLKDPTDSQVHGTLDASSVTSLSSGVKPTKDEALSLNSCQASSNIKRPIDCPSTAKPLPPAPRGPIPHRVADIDAQFSRPLAVDIAATGSRRSTPEQHPVGYSAASSRRHERTVSPLPMAGVIATIYSCDCAKQSSIGSGYFVLSGITEDQAVAGSSLYQDNIIEAVRSIGPDGRIGVVLVPEPLNAHDKTAVRVDVIARGRQLKAGYLPRQDARQYFEVLSPLAEAGRFGVVRARPFKGELGFRLYLRLEAPEWCLPRSAPTEGDLVLIAERSTVVTGVKHHQPMLERFQGGRKTGQRTFRLCIGQQPSGVHSGESVIEVNAGDHLVGRLSIGKSM